MHSFVLMLNRASSKGNVILFRSKLPGCDIQWRLNWRGDTIEQLQSCTSFIFSYLSPSMQTISFGKVKRSQMFIPNSMVGKCWFGDGATIIDLNVHNISLLKSEHCNCTRALPLIGQCNVMQQQKLAKSRTYSFYSGNIDEGVISSSLKRNGTHHSNQNLVTCAQHFPSFYTLPLYGFN